eukprot:TRINITY_DN34793_c0_g2_i3.p1 TRINITY_DN34793_c0_g2~~TRINITY_DN34793_c0_g2_i3.p1  ORF type:complete len:362 (-),score=31.17 TRINITY_DN34793_c0_g2_i3:8-1093(-)
MFKTLYKNVMNLLPTQKLQTQTFFFSTTFQTLQLQNQISSSMQSQWIQQNQKQLFASAQTGDLSSALQKIIYQEYYDQFLVGKLCELWPIQNAPLTQMSNVVKCLGSLRHFHEPFLIDLEKYLYKKIQKQFNLVSASEIVWGFAVLDYQSKQLIQLICDKILSLIKQEQLDQSKTVDLDIEFSSNQQQKQQFNDDNIDINNQQLQQKKDLIKLMWGLSISGFWHTDKFWKQTSQFININNKNDDNIYDDKNSNNLQYFDQKTRSKLFHIYLLHQQLNKQQIADKIINREQTRQILRDAWLETQSAENKQVSEFQIQVFNQLNLLKLRPSLEKKILGGLLTVDIGFEKTGSSRDGVDRSYTP